MGNRVVVESSIIINQRGGLNTAHVAQVHRWTTCGVGGSSTELRPEIAVTSTHKTPNLWNGIIPIRSSCDYSSRQLKIGAAKFHQKINSLPLTVAGTQIGSMHGIYGNIYHQYTPVLFAQIYHTYGSVMGNSILKSLKNSIPVLGRGARQSRRFENLPCGAPKFDSVQLGATCGSNVTMAFLVLITIVWTWGLWTKN